MSYPQLSSGPHPLHFRDITLGRLRSFLGTQYPSLKSVLYEASDESIAIEHWASPGRERIPFAEAIKQKFSEFKVGDTFGPSWTQHWFRLNFEVPENWKQYERFTLEFDSSSEAMVYNSEGQVQVGLTGGFGIDRRVDFILPKVGSYKLYIAASANGMFGNGLGETNNPPDDNRQFTLESCKLVAPRMDAWRLYWDFITISDLAHQLPENSPLGCLAMMTGNEIINAFDSKNLSTIAACQKLTEKFFGVGWEKLDGVFKGNPSDSTTWAIGDCHIDSAWLWTTVQTRDKAARSWSSQLDLMDRYPEYRFVASQAQQFAYVEEDQPLLFQRIKVKVATKQFQPIGGAWVEMDSNLPSGESLCRQFLYGQGYFKSRFGEISKTFWLPDSFGYSGQIPQICRLSGFDYFFTQKLSWNQFNSFPHSTFFWCGIDGTQLLTHMTPVETYTAQGSVADIFRSINKHKSLQTGAANSLLAFGNGDGGGGPLAPMLENLRRARAVSNKYGELPAVTHAPSVESFYEDVLFKTDNGAKIPVYNGELYFELHRGTYTSHGSIKYGNRKSEILLREIELAATLASIQNPSQYRYPKDTLDKLWKGLLLNQFHDILPGSAISLAYVEAEKVYAMIKTTGNQLLEDALRQLIPASSAVTLGSQAGQEIIACNFNFIARRDLIKIPIATAKLLDDVVLQISHDGSAYLLVENLNGDLFSKVSGSIDITSFVTAKAVGDDYVLENGHLRIIISSEGQITSILDISKERELLKAPAGFVIFEDRPLNWQAWDTDIFGTEKKEVIIATSIKIIENGPLRAGLMIIYHFGDSVIKAFVSLDSFASVIGEGELAGLRFDLTVDWYEKHRFLKFELPLAISNENFISQSQFGHISRPTIRNTSYDRAKFEVVGHQFMDLSEWGYGVAILNDCKYGFACEGSVMRLSLLRSPTVPAADCDTGIHHISFQIQPHASSFNEASVQQAALIFNNPPHVRSVPSSTTYYNEKPFELISRNITLETVKRGEDDHFGSKANGEKSVILRIYEARGGHGKAKLVINLPVKSLFIVDLLERPLDTAEKLEMTKSGDKASVTLKLRGFEILTLKITLI